MNIYIASFNLYERPAKIGLSLRMAGHNVFLLYCNEPNDSYFKNCFSECYRIENSAQIDELIKKLNISLVHIFSTFTDQLALYLIGIKKVKTIYDYKDIFEGLLKLKYEKEYYLQQQFLIENANYVCNRDFQINDYQRYKSIKNIKKFYYPDLVWPNQPEIKKKHQIVNNATDKIKLVIIGNIGIEKLEPQWPGVGSYYIISTLIKQGFEIHMYSTSPHQKNEEIFSDYLGLAKSNKNFVIHEPKSVMMLHEELFNYDYGLLLPQALYFDNMDSYVEESLYRSSMPARVMDYIGAGLPVLYSDSMRQINILDSFYQIGISVSRENFSHLHSHLKAIDVVELKKKALYAAVYSLNSKRWIEKLVSFYSHI